jgi:signal transduction histidine kinase
VLDLAKIESGNLEWHMAEVDLDSVLRESVETTGQVFRDNGARVEIEVPDRPARVWADRDRLVQVMLNLLSNAAKFLPAEAGRVNVAVLALEDAYEVRVEDNGPGIAQQDLGVIFDRFRQGAGGSAKPVGTGLGLPISRQIIEHLGGRMWAECMPGKGATFVFRLPRSVTTADGAGAGQRP